MNERLDRIGSEITQNLAALSAAMAETRAASAELRARTAEYVADNEEMRQVILSLLAETQSILTELLGRL